MQPWKFRESCGVLDEYREYLRTMLGQKTHPMLYVVLRGSPEYSENQDIVAVAAQAQEGLEELSHVEGQEGQQ